MKLNKPIYENKSINTKMDYMNGGSEGQRQTETVVSWIVDVFNNLPDSLFSAKIDWLMEGNSTSEWTLLTSRVPW